MQEPEGREPEDLSQEEFVRLIRAVEQGPEALELEFVALGFSGLDEAADDALRIGPRIAEAVSAALQHRIDEMDEEENG